jgi:hypothetical protein
LKYNRIMDLGEEFDLREKSPYAPQCDIEKVSDI